MFCTHCGTENLEQNNFCAHCGQELVQPLTHPSAQGLAQTPGAHTERSAQDSQTSDESEARALYTAAVGHEKAAYYVPFFLRFDREGAKASWHWPAFFITTYWLFYRKMWLWGTLYMLAPIPLSILYVFLGPGTTELLYLLVVYIVIPLYANVIYYKHVKKKIAQACENAPDSSSALRQLENKGGTSPAVIIIAIILFVLTIPLMGLLAVIGMPAYEDYKQRSRVSEGLAIQVEPQFRRQLIDRTPRSKTDTPQVSDIQWKYEPALINQNQTSVPIKL